MRDDENCNAVLFDKLADAVLAFFLEHEIAYREHFVYHKDFGNDHGGNGECNARHHSRRIVFKWHVKKLFHFCKRDDFFEVLIDEIF